MIAERLLLETDTMGRVHNLPPLPPNRRIEAIFLVLDDELPQTKTVCRAPHPDLRGQIRITGDIMESASAADWSFPR